MQKELNLFGALKSTIRDIDPKCVAACRTEQAAIRLCLDSHPARLPREHIAEMLGIKRDVLSKMANSDYYEKSGKACRYMSRTMQIQLQRICQNRAIDQWADMYEKGLLNHQRSLEEEEAILLERLGEIQAERNC